MTSIWDTQDFLFQNFSFFFISIKTLKWDLPPPLGRFLSVQYNILDCGNSIVFIYMTETV